MCEGGKSINASLAASIPMKTNLKTADANAITDLIPVVEDVAYLRTVMVNLYFIGPSGAGDREWVLVDAGMSGYSDQIAKAAERRFGHGCRPSAIILTHGHFDHVGSLAQLAQRWEVPIYAHSMELPYLTGKSSYPPPDPSVGGGLISALSWSFPIGPVDFGDNVRALSSDTTVPGLHGWRWIFTPGHTPGHVSLFRDADRMLIAGDAIVTTQQESAYAVISQRRELHGPPMYFTPDWKSAANSVVTLAELAPEVVASGHGEPLWGAAMRADLQDLAQHFGQRALPRQGRYLKRSAVTDQSGIVELPPDDSDLVPRLLGDPDGPANFVKQLLGDDAERG
jgi:glyoxylase-like metal-dependent hydrolase (beta-lactamase superfamily II)